MFAIMEKEPTLFVAVCAIFVPVIITAIQCFADWAIKRCQSKKDYEYKIKREQCEIYTSYLRYAGQFLLHPSAENESTYGEAYFQILAIATKELRDKIIECNDLIRDKKFKGATKSLEEIIPTIHDILNRLY